MQNKLVFNSKLMAAIAVMHEWYTDEFHTCLYGEFSECFICKKEIVK